MTADNVEGFGRHVLDVNAPDELDRIAAGLKQYLRSVKRRGVVVAVSGGIDSSVAASAAVHALGNERVFALHLPERESSTDSLELSTELTNFLGVQSHIENITPTLDALGCYQRRDDAIRQLYSQYGDGYRSKIVLPPLSNKPRVPLYWLVIESPRGEITKLRLNHRSYLAIVAATNFKQRVRKLVEYYHADRLNYAVVGTPNRLEFDQGFFVKLGDGAADVKPIAHLYKSQVYALASHLDLPSRIQRRPPTTDTYSLAQSQEEFYFSVPYDVMDLCLYARDHGISILQVANALKLEQPLVQSVFVDIDRKRAATRYLHSSAALIDPEILSRLDERLTTE